MSPQLAPLNVEEQRLKSGSLLKGPILGWAIPNSWPPTRVTFSSVLFTTFVIASLQMAHQSVDYRLDRHLSCEWDASQTNSCHIGSFCVSHHRSGKSVHVSCLRSQPSSAWLNLLTPVFTIGMVTVNSNSPVLPRQTTHDQWFCIFSITKRFYFQFFTFIWHAPAGWT